MTITIFLSILDLCGLCLNFESSNFHVILSSQCGIGLLPTIFKTLFRLRMQRISHGVFQKSFTRDVKLFHVGSTRTCMKNTGMFVVVTRKCFFLLHVNDYLI